MTLGRRLVSLSALLALLAPASCKDKGKESADGAMTSIPSLVKLSADDVAEIERGLPEGGKKIAAALANGDPKTNSSAVRAALLKVRQQVPDLGKAKSTFFAFTDDKGIAIRNDLEQDTMAGKDVVAAYPAFKEALAGKDFVVTQGQFPGAPNPQGPDKEWVAAVPVKHDDGSLEGLLVTGWTYRRFAYHLQESLKRDLQDQLMRSGDNGKLPVLYVFLFDKDSVYGARGTPQTDEDALKTLDLVGKTAATGSAEGPLMITDRAFGWAAARAPKLGDGVGIVILRSEI